MQWPGYMIQVGGNAVAWVHDTGGGQWSGLGTQLLCFVCSVNNVLVGNMGTALV